MKITVLGQAAKTTIECEQGNSILNILHLNHIYLCASCGGNGTCHKCKVRFLTGPVPCSAADKECFREEELSMGWRLACCAYPLHDCSIRIFSEDEADFSVISHYAEEANCNEPFTDGECYIGIDIGTTTIAMTLTDCGSRRRLAVYSAVNRQRAYGADVISRIQAANGGKLAELTRCIKEDLFLGIQNLLEQAAHSGVRIKAIIISGNTTMLHLLLEYSCKTLGIYPFTPISLETAHLLTGTMFSQQMNYDDITAKGFAETEVVCLPGISAFVGADVCAGMLYCGFQKAEKFSFLIDLGTNGEMALGNKDKVLVASAAAGPAFEGGNISCGTGSIPGAVCGITCTDSGLDFCTIGDKPPVGICGTGVIELVYELLKQGLIDETGLLADAYFESGVTVAVTNEGIPIVFKQQDIREVQLAKSAIRAGIETLLRSYGLTYDQVDKVFLAGGFGYQMDIRKAVGIGMLPDEWKDRIQAVGNSSLAGTMTFAFERNREHIVKGLIRNAEEITLSEDKNFNELYMKYMMFE